MISALRRLAPRRIRRKFLRRHLADGRISKALDVAESLDEAAVQNAIASILDLSSEARDFAGLELISQRCHIADSFDKFLFEALSSFAANPNEMFEKLEAVETSNSFGPFERMCVRCWRLFLTSLPIDIAVRDERSEASVIQFWSQTKAPAEIVRAISAWKGLFGDNHQCFHLSDAVSFLKSEYGRTEAEMLRNAPHPAIQADLFRLAYLAVSGGVYLDADTLPRSSAKDVIELMAGTDVLTFETTRPRLHIQNALIVARPGSQFLADCAVEAFQRVQRMDQPVQALAGGYLMTDIATRPGVDMVARSITTRFAVQNIVMPVKRSYARSELDWRVWDQRRLATQI